MLQVTNITKSYGKQVLFDGISFMVNPRERIGLVGRNGTGKTTLFRMVLGQEHPDTGTISTPSGYTIGHLSQHINFSEKTVIKEACINLPATADFRDETYKAQAILFGLGFIAADMDKAPSELSGGYQVRLNLAKVLVSQPDLLLLDEPTNYLDIVSVRWITQFLRSWQSELIIITHDRDFMDSVTTHTMGIHRCKIKKIVGDTQKLYDQILLEEEVHEKTRLNDEKKRREIQQFINRFRAQANKARAVQSRIKALAKHEKLDKLEEIKTLDFAFQSAPFEAKWLMNIENLAFSFGSTSPYLFDALTFSVGKNDRIAVIGKNGKGKTTLLNLLASELTPNDGKIKLHTNTKIAYFGQTNIDRLQSENTALQEIMASHPDHNRNQAYSICGLMMFEGEQSLKKISVLSGGEKSRVLLGKLLVSPANLLILDEPTNHLDMESIDSLIEAINAFDGAVIIVTHSEMILEAIATKLIVFDAGIVTVFDGTYFDFLERMGWQDEETSNSQMMKNKEVVKSISKKDVRKSRAGIISEKSKVLGALKNQIATIEAEITRLEKAVEVEIQILLDASANGKALTIKKASLAIGDFKTRIDTLYEELDKVSSEYDMQVSNFETRLNDLPECT